MSGAKPTGVVVDELTGFARELADAFEAGTDDYLAGTHWKVVADRYEDDDLRRAYLAGWTEAENT